MRLPVRGRFVQAKHAVALRGYRHHNLTVAHLGLALPVKSLNRSGWSDRIALDRQGCCRCAQVEHDEKAFALMFAQVSLCCVRCAEVGLPPAPERRVVLAELKQAPPMVERRLFLGRAAAGGKG